MTSTTGVYSLVATPAEDAGRWKRVTELLRKMGEAHTAAREAGAHLVQHGDRSPPEGHIGAP